MKPNPLPIKINAGIVPYRFRADGTAEVLLITALNPAQSWIFPMGTVDAGETPQQAAARECAEESGYIVKVGPQLTIIDLPKHTDIHRVIFFAGEVTDEEQEYEYGRQRLWVSLVDLPHIVTDVFEAAADAISCLSLIHISEPTRPY